MSQSFMLPRNNSEVDEQLEAIKTPLDKIDYLEVCPMSYVTSWTG